MAAAIKEQRVNEIKEKIQKSKALFLFQYHGLNVQELQELRSKVRKEKGEIKIFKNTLVRKALEGFPLKDLLHEDFKGPIACAFSYGDVVLTAKTLVGFTKDENPLQIKTGVLSSKKISLGEIKQLAKLPPKEILIALLVGTIAAPLRALVTVLLGSARDFVYVLKAIEDKKAKS